MNTVENNQSETSIYVSFCVGQNTFGIPIDDVKQIIRIPRITKVPKTVPYMLGISNLRGNVLPMVDLSLRLGYENKCELGEDARVIVIETSGFLTGVIVESVSEVKSSEMSTLEEMPDMLSVNVDEKYIKGILKTKDSDEKSDLLQVLDIYEVINIKELADKAGPAAGAAAGGRLSLLDEKDDDTENIRRFISFTLSGQEYSIEIHGINEIVRVPDVVKVPGLASYVVGIFSLRDDVIPLINLHSKFGRQSTETGESTRVMIIDVADTKVGFLVDRVNEVVSAYESDIEEPPKTFTGDKEREIESIIKLQGGKRLILILNTGNILDDQEIEALKNVSEKEAQKTAMDNMEEHENIEESQIVTFKIEDEEYGILIEKVQEINRYTNVTKIPKTPAFVEGIINLRGEIVPLIDLRKRFELEQKERDEFTRVIIINLGNIKVGFVVDNVDEVLRISKNQIENAPAALSSTVDTNFIDGVVNLTDKQRMILLLNVDELFTKTEIKKLENIKD